MGIDVSRFHQTFFEESIEGLEAMETGLLELEDGSEDNEAINTIFRAAHSIKGGAGTLGFAALADFTHHVETILDRRRSGRGEVTPETVDVLLASVDCMRDMLASIQHGEDLDEDRVAEVEAKLEHLVDRDGNEASPAGDGQAGDGPAGGSGGQSGDVGEPVGDGGEASGESAGQAGDGAEAGSGGWHVTFAPHPTMLRSGNDPVRILGELAELGSYEVTADTSGLPDLEELDVEVCYATWAIDLHPSDADAVIERSAIDQVFEWVEDDADIVITELTGAPPSDSGTIATTDRSTGESTGHPAPTGAAADAGPQAGPATETGPEASSNTGGSPADAGTATERRGGEDRRQAQGAHGGGSPTATSIRVDIDKVDALINMVGELVITQSMLQQLATHGENLDLDRLREGLVELEGNTRELQGSVMQIRMLPISFAFSRLPRLVRDLASKLGKKVELEISGETTEIDKTVMEKIGDPLVHLVRNSLDHGIETPEERHAAGKPEVGALSLSAFHEGGNIVVEIADDGGGLRAEKILAKARERGLVGSDEKLSDRQVHDLIFHPGFSTAEQVSDVSGRGVGMDVVKRNINDLGGVIEVTSEEGRGTTFRIRLPLTLAILDGQLVKVGDQVFIVPLVSIIESLQFDEELTGSLTRNAAVYRHRDVVIPLIDLRETLSVDSPRDPETDPLLVVVDTEGIRAGLIVDDLLAQQQIVIKSLTTNFRAVPGLSGATILGDGTVAMIVDINSLVGLYRHTAPAADRASTST